LTPLAQNPKSTTGHAVGLVSRYQSNPGYTYWHAEKQIFRYL
jgi:hypothetical protein